jgi:hypothetical protein
MITKKKSPPSTRCNFRGNSTGRSWRLNEDIGHLEKKLLSPERKIEKIDEEKLSLNEEISKNSALKNQGRFKPAKIL